MIGNVIAIANGAWVEARYIYDGWSDIIIKINTRTSRVIMKEQNCRKTKELSTFYKIAVVTFMIDMATLLLHFLQMYI